MTTVSAETSERPATGTHLRPTPVARLRNLRLRIEPASLRTRILAWFIGVLVLATTASVLVTYDVLLVRLDQRIDAELAQEASELRRLAAGNDPSTGEPFAQDTRRIFEVYLERNVPSRNEALITFLDGKPFLRSRQVVPYRVDTDPELVARWASIDRTDRGRVGTPAGDIEYLAVPLRREGRTAGVFVAAIFVERAKTDSDAAVRAAAVVGFVLLLLGSAFAWRLADRVVRPVTALTQAARSISATDFGTRIPVQGRDQVAELAATFNAMLDRLERSFSAQRRFVDDASHELRTPLTIVRGQLELLEDDPDQRRATVALVLDELTRMSRMVEDLIVLARYEQPDFLTLSTVNVGVLTDELYAKVTALAQREWSLDVRGRGIIVADRQRLTQAILQLADNAVRYSVDDRPIAIGSSVAGGEARFWIRDHGPGIAPREQTAIFERSQRGAATGRMDGSGLGLPIVKAIAEAHHGRVEIESRPGAGSRFTIVVPVDEPQSEPESTPKRPPWRGS